MCKIVHNLVILNKSVIDSYLMGLSMPFICHPFFKVSPWFTVEYNLAKALPNSHRVSLLALNIPEQLTHIMSRMKSLSCITLTNLIS